VCLKLLGDLKSTLAGRSFQTLTTRERLRQSYYDVCVEVKSEGNQRPDSQTILGQFSDGS